MKKKILFLIHDLGHGGAEKVLVNLVNNMDPEKFDITVTALFGGGVNEQFLKPHVRLRTIYKHMIRGNSHLMKLLTPKQLHRMYVKEHYDIEVAYLEGPAARIISGCTDPNTKTVYWIHCTMRTPEHFALGFRTVEEARKGYSSFDRGIFVSRDVMEAFRAHCPGGAMQVLYNTNDTVSMRKKALEPLPRDTFCPDATHLIGMGKLETVKGFDRLIRIHSRLRKAGYPICTYILGEGPLEAQLRELVQSEGVADSVNFLGYQTNPYKYVAGGDLFVCSSHSEGFSTAATEALVVGTPVVTTCVSGMKEMLGSNNEYGIVTENNEEALYQGIKILLDDPLLLKHYKKQAALRGRDFSTEETAGAVQDALSALLEK